jgi:hypothetical protein
MMVFLIMYSGGGVQLGPLGTTVTNIVACCASPGWLWWWINWWNDDCRVTEVLGENLPQCRSVHHKHRMLPGREPGPPRWETMTNRLNYGTAYRIV